MAVKVRSKVGQSVSQSLGGVGLAGGSMMLRLRRTSIALLALVGAVGLGLIVFISQLGWPAVVGGPLPSAPGRATVAPGVALTHPASATAVPAAKGGSFAAGDGSRPRRGKSGASRSAGQADLGGSRGVSTANGSQPGAGSGEPISQPTPGSPSHPASVTSPPTAPTSTSTSSGSNGSSSAAGSAKATSDGARSANLASAKSGGPKATGSGESSSAGSKSGESASVKAQHDESVAAASPPPATSAPTPAPTNPAAAKEAADSGQ